MVLSVRRVSSTVGQGCLAINEFSPNFSQSSSDKCGVIGDINWARVLAAKIFVSVPAFDFAKLFVNA